MPQIVSNTIQFHIAAYSETEQQYKFLIIQRASDLLIYPNVWQVITGTIENDETAVNCALREVQEEIGLNLSNTKLFTIPYVTKFFVPKRDYISLAPVFGAIIDKNSRILLSAEHQAYKWVSANEFDSTIILPSHREANKIFIDTILNSANSSLFELKI